MPLSTLRALRGLNSPAALQASRSRNGRGEVGGGGGGAALLRHLLFGAGLEMVEAVAMADDRDAAIQEEVRRWNSTGCIVTACLRFIGGSVSELRIQQTCGNMHDPATRSILPLLHHPSVPSLCIPCVHHPSVPSLCIPCVHHPSVPSLCIPCVCLPRSKGWWTPLKRRG